jgi:hypothetical protein
MKKLIEDMDAVITNENVALGLTWLKRKAREVLRQHEAARIASLPKDRVERGFIVLCKAMGINPDTSPAMREAFKQALAALHEPAVDEARLSIAIADEVNRQCEKDLRLFGTFSVQSLIEAIRPYLCQPQQPVSEVDIEVGAQAIAPHWFEEEKRGNYESRHFGYEGHRNEAREQAKACAEAWACESCREVANEMV